MNVIISSIPGEGAVKDALVREIKTGFELAKQMSRKNEILAAHDAQAMRGHKPIGKDANLRAVTHYDADEYFRLVKKYGFKEVNSKEFIQYFQKKFPHLSPNKI